MILGLNGILPVMEKLPLEKLEAKSYDIILMDLQMPEMNGFEATEYIRNKMNSKIPIIALTADVTTVDLAKCKAVGMNDYIAKPIDERLLYKKIVELVKKPMLLKYKRREENNGGQNKKIKCIDLKLFKWSYKIRSRIDDGDDFTLSGTNSSFNRRHETKSKR